MTETLAPPRRRRAAAALACLLGLTACGPMAPFVRDVDGLPCLTFRKTHRHNRICAAQPAPAAEVARDVKAFVPDPTGAQVLVQWLQRAGATRPLTLRVDGRAAADLVPGGLVRLYLVPGEHELAVAWGDQQAIMHLQVQAGAVQFAEVGGRSKSRDIGFGWEAPDDEGARRRAAAARVIADVDLRFGPQTVGGSVVPTP